MPHLVKTIKQASFDEALQDLRAAHHFLVARGKNAIIASDFPESCWGTSVKRSPVRLDGDDVPALIGKSEERFCEVINIVATVERLIDAINWFGRQPHSEGQTIVECHPSTSDEAIGNDLVIADGNGVIVIRCEVCDVASSKANTNNKENEDIRKLGCKDAVPRDGVDRYICTAPEFAAALVSSRRKWGLKCYRYNLIETGCATGTRMLLISPAGTLASQ